MHKINIKSFTNLNRIIVNFSSIQPEYVGSRYISLNLISYSGQPATNARSTVSAANSGNLCYVQFFADDTKIYLRRQ